MKTIDAKDIEIKKSNSKLGFSTTGGTNWQIWDRFITYEKQPLFHIGNICGTCNFFFNRKEIKINGNLTSKEISDTLNNGLDAIDQSQIDSISSILPNGKYKVLLTEITPKISIPNLENDYFTTELYETWNSDRTSHTNIEYFRGESKKIKKDEKLFEFFVPLYPVKDLNENRVKAYEKLIAKGKKPTILSLGVLDVKTSMEYPEINGEEINPEIHTHWCFANYLIDGHHKLKAASNLAKPITILTFVSKDNSWKQIDEMIIEMKK